jgi:DNA-binding CsgD family transcriptional regulator
MDVDLAVSLVDGLLETPLWATFLERLRLATGADHAALFFQPPNWPYEDSIHLLAGATPSDVHAIHRKHALASDLLRRDSMVEGRPYTLEEILGRGGGVEGGPNAAFFHELVVQRGITAIRQVRVEETSGVSAWLTIARCGPDFAAAESLLITIAPLLRSVLRQHIAAERERFAASLTADAVRRLEFGWISFDRAGNVLEHDELGGLVLATSGILSVGATGRLAAKPPELERDIFQSLTRLLDGPARRSRAFTLSRDPWLDMLLVPARRKSIGTRSPSAAIAYVHGDSWRSTDRVEQLAELFGLSPSEARLALALSRGMTIAEAAEEFGLAVGTVRNSSKAIYAKTGARGLPDLVRIVMRSVLAIAPEI